MCMLAHTRNGICFRDFALTHKRERESRWGGGGGGGGHGSSISLDDKGCSISGFQQGLYTRDCVATQPVSTMPPEAGWLPQQFPVAGVFV